MKKLGLVFGSSGARGVSYIGFIRALEENGIKADYVAGSSMGAVVGGCYAMGMTSEEMQEEITALKFSHIVDVSLRPFAKAGILRSKKLQSKLNSYFEDKRFCDLEIPFTAVAVDLLSGKEYNFHGEDSLTIGVSASSSIPGIFRPIKYKDMALIDGGVICRLPIEQVRKMGAEVVVCVDALGETREAKDKFNTISVLFRCYEIMDGKLTDYKNKEQKADLYIKPRLGEMSQYKFKNFEMALHQGYKVGIENIEKIKELIK